MRREPCRWWRSLTELGAADLGRLLCLGGATVGALGLIGWLAGAEVLTTVLSGQAPMMPNTALWLLLVGAAGALLRRDPAGGARRMLALGASVITLAMGAGTLAQYALGVDLHVDQIVYPTEAGPHPGRPSPLTALAFVFLGSAIVIFDARPAGRARPSEWLAFSAGLVGFTAVLGQVFGAGALYQLEHSPVIGVAVPTALGLLLTSAGLLLERPDAGFMRLATSRGPGGLVLRRLALAAVIAPPVLGFVVLRFFGALGVADVALVFAALAVAMTVATVGMLTVTAVPLDRAHDALEASRARARDAVEHASDGIFVANLDGRYTAVNSAGARMLGYAREEIVGKKIEDLLPPSDLERFRASEVRLFAGEVHVSEWSLLRKDGTYLPVEVSARILPDGRWQGIVRDISDRKRAEEALRQAQERFELALEGADLAAWDYNVQTGEVVFNPRWAEMRGFRPDEIPPHVDSWIRGVHPDDWPDVERVLNDTFEGRIPVYATEHRVATKTGEWIWILDRGRVFERDEAGRPTRMVGTELDITARRKAEEALRFSEAKYSGIVSISADAIVSIDEGQRISTFNTGAEEIFGYAKEAVIGAPLDVLIPERFRAAHRRHVEAFARGQDVARRMTGRGAGVLGLRKNGEEFPADATISKLDVAGRRVLTVALRDMTEQSRIQNEQRFLAEAGSVFVATLEEEEGLVDVARLAVRDLADFCIVDLIEEGGELRRVGVASREASKAWVGDRLMQRPVDGEQLRLLHTVLEANEPVLLEKVTPDGAASWDRSEELLRALGGVDPQSVIFVPLVAHDKRMGVVSLVSSRSSRPYGAAEVRLAEELARRAGLWLENVRLYRAAQRATQARDDVLGIVAHDLRNPLGTILMQAQLLRRCAPEPERRATRPADVIERAATRMNRLIQDLLDVTRIDAGRLSIERTPVPALQVVADCVDAQSALAASASLELHVDVTPGVGDVCGDRNRLLQVFENLLGNAVKFTEPGGRVTVGAAPRGSDVLFWVADTGAGISDDDRPHVFDRFWQVRSGRHRGAGLGLAIVKGIVEAHGGGIWVESTPGRGSTFFFTIPSAPRAGESCAEPRAAW